MLSVPRLRNMTLENHGVGSMIFGGTISQKKGHFLSTKMSGF